MCSTKEHLKKLINLRLVKSSTDMSLPIPTIAKQPKTMSQDQKTHKEKISQKTLIEMVILTALTKDAYRATELLEILKETGIEIPIGTLYPFMGELMREKSVFRGIEEFDYGCTHMYHISDAGKKRLSLLANQWRDFNDRFKKLRSSPKS